MLRPPTSSSPPRKMCECGHDWGTHEPIQDGFGHIFIVCMFVDQADDGASVVMCSCKQYKEVPLPST